MELPQETTRPMVAIYPDWIVPIRSGEISYVATVSIRINANISPVAVNDAGSVGVGGTVSINVVANDTDSDGTRQLRLDDSVRRRQYVSKRVYRILSRSDPAATTRGAKRTPESTRAATTTVTISELFS